MAAMRQTLADEIVNTGVLLPSDTVIIKCPQYADMFTKNFPDELLQYYADDWDRVVKPVFPNMFFELPPDDEGTMVAVYTRVTSEVFETFDDDVVLEYLDCVIFVKAATGVIRYDFDYYVEIQDGALTYWAWHDDRYTHHNYPMLGKTMVAYDTADFVFGEIVQVLNLLHQKTDVELVTPSRQVSRQIERKTGKKPSPYFEVKVDPSKPQKRYTNSKKTGRKNDAHVVRGNFATYSDDAPLFGKYIGTFWRPSHVRGNGDNVKPKDYRIVLPERGE